MDHGPVLTVLTLCLMGVFFVMFVVIITLVVHTFDFCMYGFQFICGNTAKLYSSLMFFVVVVVVFLLTAIL